MLPERSNSNVVYFHQRLGAGYYKSQWRSAFSTFFPANKAKKENKKKRLVKIKQKKHVFQVCTHTLVEGLISGKNITKDLFLRVIKIISHISGSARTVAKMVTGCLRIMKSCHF